MSKVVLPVEHRRTVESRLRDLGEHPRVARAVGMMTKVRPGSRTASGFVLEAAVRDASSVLCDALAGKWARVAKGPESSAAQGGGSIAPGYGGACFAEGTEIRMADGSSIPIEDIELSDRIRTFDLSSNSLADGEVIRVFPQEVRQDWRVLSFEGFEITSTEGHPYWTREQGWASVDPVKTMDAHDFEVSRLEAGDHCLLLQDLELSWTSVLEIGHEDEQYTYNIGVAPHGNYFANGILVHNKAPMSDEDAEDAEDDGFDEETLRLAERTVKLGYSVALRTGHDPDTAVYAALYAFTRL
jgi:hypothetical protein